MEIGFTIALPPGVYAKIALRSRFAIHNFIDVGAGFIDLNY